MSELNQHKVNLKVRSAKLDDVYKDVVRISKQDRGALKPSQLCRFKTHAGTAYFILRGTKTANNGKILIDEDARAKLNLQVNSECEFEIREAGFWGELQWAFYATDPAYRIAARLGVLSLLLGILAFVPILQDIVEWVRNQ